jgi:uncharacterized repeat protein (TIGR03803 family)
MSLKKTALMAAVSLALCAGGAQAQSFHTLYRFHGADGRVPMAPLVVDGAGNIYGTTNRGGTDDIGTVFRLAPGRSEGVLHSFTGNFTDGALPWGGITVDGAGNIYGAASSWGAYDGGALFKVAPDGSESLLHSFGYYENSSDGSEPGTKPLIGADGNLYGTTPVGGYTGWPCSNMGCGTIYRVTPEGTETVLHAFNSGDGAEPAGELIADGSGNLYGTTIAGGGGGRSGTVFKFAPDGTLTTLHSFKLNGTRKDGVSEPVYGLVRDAAGNLYGVLHGTSRLHEKRCPDGACGAIFMLTADGKLHLLHEFTGGADGGFPNSTMVMDAGGSLYGTTKYGGGIGCKHMGCGTVFRYSPDGSIAILHAFGDREGPPNGVTFGPDGALYGAAFSTDDQAPPGIIFRIDL